MTDEKKSNAAATGIAMLIILIAAFALCQLLAGCVSVVGRAYGITWGHPYAGTRLALSCAPMQPALYADAPLDAVLDTALLPFDLIAMPFID